MSEKEYLCLECDSILDPKYHKNGHSRVEVGSGRIARASDCPGTLQPFISLQSLESELNRRIKNIRGWQVAGFHECGKEDLQSFLDWVRGEKNE